MQRDLEVYEKLSSLGWNVFVIWQCQTKKAMDLENLIDTFFSSGLKESNGR